MRASSLPRSKAARRNRSPRRRCRVLDLDADRRHHQRRRTSRSSPLRRGRGPRPGRPARSAMSVIAPTVRVGPVHVHPVARPASQRTPRLQHLRRAGIAVSAPSSFDQCPRERTIQRLALQRLGLPRPGLHRADAGDVDHLGQRPRRSRGHTQQVERTWLSDPGSTTPVTRGEERPRTGPTERVSREFQAGRSGGSC